MNRTSAMSATLWLLLVAAQLWVLGRLETLLTQLHQVDATATMPNELNAAAARDSLSNHALSPSQNTSSQTDTVVLLQRIDDRLSALEQRLGNDSHRDATATNSNREPSTRERALADQRLASLLPNGPLSREDVARFHADLQALPPDERFATATALSRAINEGRIQPAPGAF